LLRAVLSKNDEGMGMRCSNRTTLKNGSFGR